MNTIKNNNKKLNNEKLIVVLGPTASGKSELAVKLARKFKGEVISADSRQVYRGMDIGTGKISLRYGSGQAKKTLTHKGIPHYCIDVTSPKKLFTVTEYRKLALLAIKKIRQKGKVPILCGGTGFYIQAVVDGIIIPEIKPDWKLRAKLEKLTTGELFKKLQKLDKKRAKNIDRNNKRRLIRALEVVIKTKKPVPEIKKDPLPYPILMIGIKTPKNDLEKRITKRVEKMIKMGLEKEAKKFPLPVIGYQEWKEYFNKKIKKEEVKKTIILHSVQYAKRQMTWFKKQEKNRRIHWVKNYKQAEKLTKIFLE